MRKLTLFVAFFAVISVGANAADPVPMNQKAKAMKEKITPRAVKNAQKLKPAKAATEEASQDYNFEIDDLEVSRDPATCAMSWRSNARNTGTTKFPGGLAYDYSVYYGADGEEQEHLHDSADLTAHALGDDISMYGPIPTFDNLRKVVVRLKGGNEVLVSKEAPLSSAVGAFSVSLGDLQVLGGGQLAIPLTITSDEEQAISDVSIHIIAQTNPDISEPPHMFPVYQTNLGCIPVGQTQNVTFAAPTQQYIALDVDIYRGSPTPVASRTYSATGN